MLHEPVAGLSNNDFTVYSSRFAENKLRVVPADVRSIADLREVSDSSMNRGRSENHAC
jgi:hypothetical protein